MARRKQTSRRKQSTSSNKKKSNKKWMQKAAKRMERKGTEGSFTRWCKKKGYGGVTSACIKAGLNAGGKIAKKANFAKNARKAKR